jgi:redox-sensitive bicupin YhaK (pirin superfamily)
VFLEGGGVKLLRSIGSGQIDHLDPFLLLDEFKSDKPDDYIAGFPDHPHRGFETVTYMLAGHMEHRDHKGNKGNLVAGSVQWMTAGRGIVHSEMPKQDNGMMWGFQLWVNLPSKDKMCPPRYQDIPPEKIPQVIKPDNTKIRVIAGECDGVKGAVTEIVTQPTYLDVSMPKNATFSHSIPLTHNVFAYVFEGRGHFKSGPTDSKEIEASTLVGKESLSNSSITLSPLILSHNHTHTHF